MCIYMFCLIFFTLLIFIYIYNELNKQNETFSNDYDLELGSSNQLVNNNPINIYDNIINSDECNQLLEISDGKFIQSSLYNSKSGFIDTKSRSSTNFYFNRGENELIRKIENKISNLLNINLDQIEPLQIAKYEKGQEYKYHYDYFDDTDNQRQYSIIIYLNDLDELDGGATHFPLYKCKFYPYKGRAVQWNNINSDKSLNKLSLHAGQPILTDKTKYILTIWTREKTY
jgi:prolyl 4-hydroxylase